jgi:hypothetical protein
MNKGFLAVKTSLQKGWFPFIKDKIDDPDTPK